MFQEDVRLLERGMEAYNRQDADAMVELLDPDCVIVASPLGLWSGREFHGHEGAREYFRMLWDQWTGGVQIETDEFLEAGERILAVGHIRALASEAGAELLVPAAAIWTFRGGKAYRMENFFGPDAHTQAFESAGLEAHLAKAPPRK